MFISAKLTLLFLAFLPAICFALKPSDCKCKTPDPNQKHYPWIVSLRRVPDTPWGSHKNIFERKHSLDLMSLAKVLMMKPFSLAGKRDELSDDYKINRHLGNAIILNEYWLLTAARNVHSTIPDHLLVGLNIENDLVRIYDEKPRLVQQVTFSPSFCTRQNTNDIALIRLENPLVFNEHVQPACIFNSSLNLPDQSIQESIFTAIGWGSASKLLYDVESGYKTPVNMSRYLKTISVKDTTSVEPECGRKLFDVPYRHCVQSKSDVSLCDGDAGGAIMLEENGRSIVTSIISYDKPRKTSEGRYRMENCYGDYVATRINQRFHDWITMQTKSKMCIV